eukprot:6381496-Pyramimonas_sp.AAC.1
MVHAGSSQLSSEEGAPPQRGDAVLGAGLRPAQRSMLFFGGDATTMTMMLTLMSWMISLRGLTLASSSEGSARVAHSYSERVSCH